MYINGKMVDSEVYALNISIRQYNDRLSFDVNEDTGDYCIFMDMPSPEPRVPVLGFGNKVPSIDEARKKLYLSDTQVHGMKIYDQILKSQEDFKKEKQYVASQRTGDAAERITSELFRKGGVR